MYKMASPWSHASVHPFQQAAFRPPHPSPLQRWTLPLIPSNSPPAPSESSSPTSSKPDASTLLDKAVVINLDRHAVRYRETCAFMEKAGFTNIQRFPAIDGFTEPPETFDKYKMPRSLAPGLKGCAASHLTIWQQFIDADSRPYLFVAEDDMLPHSDFATLFPQFWAETPESFDMVFVGHQERNASTTAKLISVPTYCTHAYIISKHGAKKLIDLYLQLPSTDRDIHVIDIFLNVHMGRRQFTYYLYNAISYPDKVNTEFNRIRKTREGGICFQNILLGSSIHTKEIVYD